ncbi:MAG: hypothetical protein KAT32_00785 [Candidatus Moranbacteria bacterium]|nr:hypothetical protein [Candidatus Moranbacteria bacterium]
MKSAILNTFPEDWKITEEDYNNFFQKVIQEKFIKFSKTNNNTYDVFDTIKVLFPKISVKWFMCYLSFYLYDPKSFLTTDLWVSIDGLVSFRSEEEKRRVKNEKINTINLMKKLFLNFYGKKEKLEKIKKSLEKISEFREENKVLAINIVIIDFLETFK